jgi:hypothetical protein
MRLPPEEIGCQGTRIGCWGITGCQGMITRKSAHSSLPAPAAQGRNWHRNAGFRGVAKASTGLIPLPVRDEAGAAGGKERA